MASRKFLTACTVLLWVAAAPASADPSAAAIKPPPALARLTQDVEVAGLLNELRDQAKQGNFRFDNIQLVDPLSGTISANRSVLVQGGRISWVGETGKAPAVDGVRVIDGNGRYLSPGLSDMHIHTTRADGWLLNLAAGVTTVRDMDGYPWMLAARDHINDARMLGPVDYVAGEIIASQPLDDYAVVVTNPSSARRVVREQAACGYDFIKVHNLLRQQRNGLFDAVADQARIEGMDLVGHVPHDISLYYALHVGRMRTTEHLKGFLLDTTMMPSNEDFAQALAGVETWIDPTLYGLLAYERGPYARAILDGPIARYVPPGTRREWAALLARPDPNDAKTYTTFKASQAAVMARLLPLKPHWLTGTDAEGYAFNVMGFALIDELHRLGDAGLTPAQVLRASTIEAAAALREPGEFGQVAKGFRADLILLDRNPLTDKEAFDSNQGVMAHGHWMDRHALDAALARLALIYADDRGIPGLSRRSARALLERVGREKAAGFVFDDSALDVLAVALREARLPDIAASAEALEITPRSGPCAAKLPVE